MDLNQALAMIGRMFPSVDLSAAVKQAQKALQGAPNNLQGASQVASSMGINQAAIDAIYNKYGRSIQARTICGILGTTPEAIKADADNIIGGVQPGKADAFTAPKMGTGTASRKFPRL